MGLQYFVASVFLLFGLCNSTTDTITPSQPIKDGDHLVSNDETFALGFFSPGNGSSNRRYAGIWYNKISEQNSEQNVVWVANRDSPINGTSGVISINQYGNLVIYDDNTHNVAWQSNVSATEMATNNSYSARLLDSGNLVVLLQGGTDNSLWQSFDYPTNTALPKFKLGLDRRTGLDRIITSWRSIDDPGTGEYSFRLDPIGLPQLVLYKGTVPRWRTSPWIWAKKAGNLTNSMFNINYIDNPEEVSMVYYQSATIMSKILVDHLGTVKADSCQKDHCKWNRFYSAPDERCDNYGRCGENGYCDGFKVLAEFECSCLPGYEPKSMNQWNLRDASGGCVNKRNMCGNGEGFVKVEGIKLPDTSRARVESRSLSMKDCEVVCRMNCSCTAYTSGDEGNCITWHGSLMDAIASYIDTYYMYIRVDADELARRSKENSTSPPSYLKEKSRSPHGNGKKIVIVVTSVVMSVFVIFLICWLVMKKTRRDARFNHQANDEEKLELPIFAMISIAAATNNFSEANKIGEGGFGPVYKGQLSMGKDIAVKRLSTSSKQGVDEFKNEVILIAKLQHRNLVRLLGCCIHGEERMLVYEYMPNGSLDSFIFGSENKSKLLTWTTRLDIIVGIARGVVYLHQDSRLRIVHRDLKVSNVLLDGEMNPKISDFGLARTFGSDQSSANTRRVVGTYGYMSPEYVIDGHFSMKSDVFSFGVIVLEIINGNRNRMFHHLDHDLNLLGHAWKLWIEGRAYELLDQRMEGSLPMSKALRCIHIGLLCVQKCLEDRPTMSSVLSMLVTDTIILPQPKQPGFYTERSTIEPHDHPQAENTPSINEVTITRLEAR